MIGGVYESIAVHFLALLIFGIMGFTVYAGDPDPNVPIAMIAAIAVCALIMLGITIRSFIRLSRNRENPVLIGFLFKFPLMIFTLGLCWFALDIPEVGWLAMILSIPLGIGCRTIYQRQSGVGLGSRSIRISAHAGQRG